MTGRADLPVIVWCVDCRRHVAVPGPLMVGDYLTAEHGGLLVTGERGFTQEPRYYVLFEVTHSAPPTP